MIQVRSTEALMDVCRSLWNMVFILTQKPGSVIHAVSKSCAYESYVVTKNSQ